MERLNRYFRISSKLFFFSVHSKNSFYNFSLFGHDFNKSIFVSLKP